MPTATQNRTCKVCRESRLALRQNPRPMVVLPTWTMGENRQKLKHAVYVCENCDGDVLELARRKVKEDT